MKSLILGEWLKIILIGHIKKFKLSEDICKAFISRLLITIPLSLSFSMMIDDDPTNADFFSFFGISDNSFIFFNLSVSYFFFDLSSNIFIFYSSQVKAINCWFMFHIDHLNFIDQSSLRTIFNRNIVIAVDEVFICWLNCLELVSQEGTTFVQLSIHLLFSCFRFKFLFGLWLLAWRLTLVLGMLLWFYRFCTFRFSKGMGIDYGVFALFTLKTGLPWVLFWR